MTTRLFYFLFKVFKFFSIKKINNRYFQAIAKLFDCNDARVFAFTIKNTLYG